MSDSHKPIFPPEPEGPDGLPARLELVEDGQWVMPPWGRFQEDELWESDGWIVRYMVGGKSYFRDWKKSIVKQWLASKGYEDTGDGRHYKYRGGDAPG